MKTIESNPILRYIPHRSPSALSLTWIKNYLETSWKIDPQSNRMGLRLNPLNLATQKQKLAEANVPEKVLSQGTFFGVIQLTQDGTPIILGADAQTMGGYPIVGCVIEEDLWKCGQVLPQQEITLRSVSISAKKSLTPSKKRT